MPSNLLNPYMEYGAVAVIVGLFIMLITNLIKSQKEQSDDLDTIRQDIVKIQVKTANVESIVLKLIDRLNRSDETNKTERDRRHEAVIGELDDLANSVQYLLGKLNGRSS
jgi:hypothetical protein